MSVAPISAEWPESFAALKLSPPAGYSLATAVISPAVTISRSGAFFSAHLVGRHVTQGAKRLLPLARAGANYVVDGQMIRPLPRDAAQYFASMMNGRNPTALKFKDVLELMREGQDGLEVIVDEAIFLSANNAANQAAANDLIPGLHATLYSYQAKGVAWMRRCISDTGGLVLADEMGLGKTIQIIGLLLLDPPPLDSPALIICPTTLIANWCRELERFAPSISFMVHRGSERAGDHKGLRLAQVVITTYDTLVNDISLFRSVQWAFVITDEAQAIKNPRSQRRRAVVQVPRSRSIAVTGTPVENSLKDLWSLVDFAIPGLLGTESEFELLYPNGAAAARELARVTAPFVIKRQIADVAQDLPERIECDLPLELGTNLASQYDRIRTETLALYPVAGALVATGQLQLFCAHPWLRRDNQQNYLDENVDYLEGPDDELVTPKIARTIELLEEAFGSNKKVLIFSIFNRIGPLVRRAATALPTAYWGSINGATEQVRRQEIVDEFSLYNGPGVLILNPKAAGAGLNIVAATIVIHYTQVWNPAIEAQASARAHRRGQNHPVTIHRLYYEDTVERVMLDRTAWKRDLANDAVPISVRNESDLKQALAMSPLK